MTVTDIEALPEADLILTTWALYRRSQAVDIPAAGAGDLIRAQSRLVHLVGPYTTSYGPRPVDPPDYDAIWRAVEDLFAVIEWHCGRDVADQVGDEAA